MVKPALKTKPRIFMVAINNHGDYSFRGAIAAMEQTHGTGPMRIDFVLRDKRCKPKEVIELLDITKTAFPKHDLHLFIETTKIPI